MCHSLHKHPTGQLVKLINRSCINKERCGPQRHRPRERAYRAGHRQERADEPMQVQESYALNSMRGTPPKYDVPLTTQKRRINKKPDRQIRLTGGRYWDRTSDLFRVKEARYPCANRPRWVRDSNRCIRLCRPLPRLSANPPHYARERWIPVCERMTGLEPATLTLAR